MNRTVTFANREISHVAYWVEDAFNFNPKGRFLWFKKLVWKFLWKTKCLKMHQDYKTTITHTTIDTDHVIHRLFQQKEALQINFNREPRILLIGSRDFAELMSQPYTGQYMEFNAEYRKATPSSNPMYNYQYRVIGLNVQVIPWMSGMVVMP